MTNTPSTSGPQESGPARTERRQNPIAGRLGTARSAVLGRGLDALLGNLGRTAPKANELAAEPSPGMAGDDTVDRRNQEGYQAQVRRALLSRIQTSAPAVATVTTPTPAAPVRSEPGRGYIQLMQAGQNLTVAPTPAAGGAVDENRVILIEVERLEPSPYLGEHEDDPVALRALAQSLRELGVWQPVVVMPANTPSPDGTVRYWIVAGEQRWRAARMVGQREVPALVRQVSPRAGIQMTLAATTHQERMSPLARCRLYETLTGEMGMRLEDAAARVGVEVTAILSSLAVLEADECLQEAFERGDINADIVAHLMKAPTPDLRRELLRYAARYRWTAERLEKALQDRGVAVAV